MYAHASLSQDGFCHKGLWVEHPFGLQGAFSAHMWLGRSTDFWNKKYVVSAGFSLLP